MTNPYYNNTANPAPLSRGTSALLRSEHALVAAGFDLVAADLSGKAPLASPALTGIPTAPTAAPLAGSNQLATVAYADAAVEVEASARRVVTGLLAPNESPTFTGTVTVPTPLTAMAAVTKAYADGLSFASALPGQSGNAGKFIKTNGATASWEVAGVTIRYPRSSNTTLVQSDTAGLFDYTGAFTQTLTAAATLAAGWYCYLRNAGNGDITVDPNGAELIDGVATYVLKPGFSVMLTCDGTGFNVLALKERTYTNVLQYTASSTFVVPAGCYVMRPYAFGKGGDGTTTKSGGGGGCAYGDIAVVPGQTVTLTISSGVSTVVYGGVTLLTANAAVMETKGTASKHVSVTNGGAYAGGDGYGSGVGGAASSGSPLGNGYGITSPTSRGGCGWGGVGNGYGGGGAGGPASTAKGGGPGLSVLSIDPLLADLTGLGGPYVSAVDTKGGNGGPGGGGGTNRSTSGGSGGDGGFGGGGGGSNASGLTGIDSGDGGFGGGGGGGAFSGGAGGYGGGGGSAPGFPGLGGAAAIRIYF